MSGNTDALRLLSLGAGVQSTTLLLLSASGELPRLDGAIFSDTGWEPEAVYEHLDRLEAEVARPAGIPIYRVSRGNLADDLLDPDQMAMIPAYTAGPETQVTVIDAVRPCDAPGCRWAEWNKGANDAVRGEPADWHGADALFEWETMNTPPPPCAACGDSGRIIVSSHTETRSDRGMLKRKCTQTYKLDPIRTQTRILLGAPQYDPVPCRYCGGTGRRVAPWRAKRGDAVEGACSVCRGTGAIVRVGQPPAGLWAEQWVGFSTDEITRVSGHSDTRYVRSRYPLLDLNMSRTQCDAYLKRHGWTSVAKSACKGCPYHGNRHWREMRDQRPAEFAEAVAFDEAYRSGPGMRSERFLHVSCKPLAEAPIEKPQRTDLVRVDVYDTVYEARMEDGDPDGCSPHACRSGEAVA